MYRCKECGKNQPRRTKPTKVVKLYRKKVYPKRFEQDTKICIDEGGSGWEIVKEVVLCPKCS